MIRVAAMELSTSTIEMLKRCGLLAAATLVLYKLHRKCSKKPTGVPFAKGHWLLGNLPELVAAINKHESHDFFFGLHKELGKTFGTSIPLQPTVIDTTDPKVVEHVLKTNFDNYVKGAWFRYRLTDLLGDGIFNVDGHKWSAQRKISSHMFTQNQFKNHIWNVIGNNCDKLVKLLRSTPEGKVVDVFNVMNRFTLDTIGQVGFARDIGSLDNPESPFLKSFDRAQQISVLRFIMPFWQVYRMLGVGYEAESRHHFKLLSDYSFETVHMLKEDPTGEKSDSFVGMFIQDAKKNGNVYSDVFLKDMVLNFLIAGRDTTAQALSWIFWLLAQHPAVEDKILKEVKDVVGDGPLTYENSAKLKYVQNVINEGLRLYPSVPNDSKIAVNDDTLPGGIFIPAGTVVQYSPYSMGRDKDLWGADAEEFRPERWEGRELPSPYEYPAFNAGPRECLGKRLAWVEMRACLARVVRAVHFELAVPANEIKKDTQLTIGMSTGLPCRVISR